MRNPELHGKFSSPVVIKKTPNYAFLWVNVISMRVGDLNLILKIQCGSYH